MKIKKLRYTGEKTSPKELFFVNLHAPNMRVSAGVRDWIVPYTHVLIETKANGDFVIIPSNDNENYKFSIINGHGKFSCSGLIHAMHIKERVRIPCEKLPDGSILCKASTVK